MSDLYEIKIGLDTFFFIIIAYIVVNLYTIKN